VVDPFQTPGRVALFRRAAILLEGSGKPTAPSMRIPCTVRNPAGMKHTLLRAAALAATAVAVTAVGSVTAAVPASADPVILGADAPGAIKDRYIVKLKDTRTAATAMTGKHGGRVRHKLDIINGYSAEMTAAQARAVAADPAVASVEQAHRMVALDTQNNPPNWGDDRVDQRDLPLNRAFTYPANPGQGAHVYVLDTGINANHVDFSGRISGGADFIDNDYTPQDCHGHGTHVAGTAAGTTYGIAKKATIHAVRVLDCQGSGANDDIIAGINWVRNNAVKPAVVNYSIGCQQRCSDASVDNAVRSLISSGVQFVQAAGNSTDDACYYSPQSLPEAITVGNSNRNDSRSSSSNYGSCLDLFAPGESIVSASHSSSTGSATMTGTSMASPHVAGAAAVYLAKNPSASPAAVRDALVTNATPNKLSGIGNSANRLLYTGFMNGDGGGGTPTCATLTNGNDVAIADNSTVQSTITSTCTGTASATSTVAVAIQHTFRGDLVIDLVAPDGSAYRIKNSNANDSADNVTGTATLNLSSESRSGTWRLRVQDVAANDVGRIDSWSLTL